MNTRLLVNVSLFTSFVIGVFVGVLVGILITKL